MYIRRKLILFNEMIEKCHPYSNVKYLNIEIAISTFGYGMRRMVKKESIQIVNYFKLYFRTYNNNA